MRKLCYRKICPFLLLLILTMVFTALFVLRLGVFGSKVDWISQHSVLPDYFRQQFYDTGELFPEFALNIGGGQNIYNFAYYGLYSPIVLISYLFPFIKMSDYMMLAQFLCLAASVMLLGGWLMKRGISEKISFCMAVIFLLSGPMLYHSYNQIMFVNYMPFLLMGFLGADRYFGGRKGPGAGKHRRFGLLLSSVFLMIMTSFYFSIGGMLVLVLYGIHRYMEVLEQKGEELTLKKFIGEGVQFAAIFLLAVMLSGVLLVPAGLALTGRGGSVSGVSIAELFFPKVSPDRFFYSPYGIGLTTLGVTALAAMLFFKRISARVLAACCIVILTVPVFAWLLNGGLYIRDKVMIPFLPLLCYITANYLNSLEKEKAGSRITAFLPYLMTLLLIYAERHWGDVGKYWKLVFLDGVVMFICFVIFRRGRIFRRGFKGKKDSLLLLLPAIVFLTLYGAGLHEKADYAVDREFYREITDKDAEELIAEMTDKEKGFFRAEQSGTDEENAANLNRVRSMGQYISSVYSSSYNGEYQKFRRDTFGVEEPFRNFLMQSPVHNPVYLDFMGVKYLVSKEEPAGYKLTGSKGKWKVYENEDALPIAYATNKVMGEDEYRELAFPYNQLALREYAVVSEDGKAGGGGSQGVSENMPACKVKQIDAALPERIQTQSKKEFTLTLPAADVSDLGHGSLGREGRRVLFLQFRVRNLKPSKDITVWVAGTRNKLTSRNHFYYNDNTKFTYAVLLDEGQTELPMTFGKGEYEITDAECFIAELSSKDDRLCQAEFRADKKLTRGNVIAGRIEAEKAGYFITSIPYDKSFEIWVDGKKIRGEKVNTAFLGCRIEKGEHEIKLVYHAPGAWEGKLLSLAGAVILLLLFTQGFAFTRRKASPLGHSL